MENQEERRDPNNIKVVGVTAQVGGKRVMGAAILVIGLALLAKQMGVLMPSWLFSWPMILIVIGIASGIKHQFRNMTWLILISIGTIFLLDQISPQLSVHQYTWPVFFIILGLWFIFGKSYRGNCGPRRRWRHFDEFQYQNFSGAEQTQNPKNDEPVGEEKRYRTTGDDYIDSVSVFGGTKKSILSKNFKGGEIVTIMGGAEINLVHSDINGVVVLDVTQIFGGTKIYIPPTWDVNSEMAAIFGGIDDKRSLTQVLTDKSKVLVIKGTSIFGGIEIKNF